MCGIAGFVYKNKIENLAEIAQNVSARLKHRGPDDEGFMVYDFIQKSATPFSGLDTILPTSYLNYLPQQSIHNNESENALCLIHRRLSILDLSENGHQPMTTEGRYWITFNGEIYNYKDIRDELITLGFEFRTRTDTEVILKAFEAWNTDCFSKLNGMFAFALFDITLNKLWIVRDPFGIKPVYYTNNEHLFAFGSEQKAFWALPNFKPTVCERSAADYLLFGRLEENITGLVKEINELKPGKYLEMDFSINHFVEIEYYKLEVLLTDRSIIDDPISEIRKLVINSIERRSHADVSVASFLSGGVDSSIITSYLAKFSENKIDAFTATFEGDKADESEFALQIVKNTDANWNKISATALDFAHDLPFLVYHNDLPILHTSTYAQLKLMQSVRQNGHKIVLDGQGGDELFAGYDRYFPIYFNELGFFEKLKFFAQIKNSPISISWLLTYKIKASVGKFIPNKLLINQKLVFDLLSKNLKNEALLLDSSIHFKDEHNLNQRLANDFTENDIKNLVRWADRTGMAASVEVRLPLADDKPLIEYMMNLPARVKIQKGWGKFLFRKAFEDILPEKITWRRDKKGFTSPLVNWMVEGAPVLVNYLSPHINKYINAENIQAKFLEAMGKSPSMQTAQLWLRIISFAVLLDEFELGQK